MDCYTFTASDGVSGSGTSVPEPPTWTLFAALPFLFATVRHLRRYQT